MIVDANGFGGFFLSSPPLFPFPPPFANNAVVEEEYEEVGVVVVGRTVYELTNSEKEDLLLPPLRANDDAERKTAIATISLIENLFNNFMAILFNPQSGEKEEGSQTDV
jgi:hypothetical protein